MGQRFIHLENAQRKGIYREAYNLLREGWHVMARHIPGFQPPPEIEGYKPDIYAVKEDKTYIIDLSIAGEENQNKVTAHVSYASFDKSTDFVALVVDGAGRRVSRRA